MPDDAAQGFDTVEIGDYEAQLKSLRDAATTLNEAEQHPNDSTGQARCRHVRAPAGASSAACRRVP
jgi:hypothetical protein